MSQESVGPRLAETVAEQRLRIVASLIRVTGDWDLAEDAVADATERALRTWPRDGVPANPAAWLTTTARRRALDVIRRAGTERAKLAEVALMADRGGDEQPETSAPWTGVDDRLRLLFTCCHPALPLEGRVALTCRVVAGLSTRAIARAFLVSETTMGQRLLRAKHKIAAARIGYHVPGPEMLPQRLDAVLAVLYLVFTTGWAARADDGLAEEAIRLTRLLVELMPEADEAHGLLALMLLQHARRDARVVDGQLVTLEHQDRTRWHDAEIDEGLRLAARRPSRRGRYAVQADLAAVHARAGSAEDTDWPQIVELYDELVALDPSPVVALNRSVAVGMADGAPAGLAALDDVRDHPALATTHLLPAVQADLLARAGRRTEAVAALDRAIGLAASDRERRSLAARRDDLA